MSLCYGAYRYALLIHSGGSDKSGLVVIDSDNLKMVTIISMGVGPLVHDSVVSNDVDNMIIVNHFTCQWI